MCLALSFVLLPLHTKHLAPLKANSYNRDRVPTLPTNCGLTYRFAKALDCYIPTWITLWDRVSFKRPLQCCYRALTASPWIAVKVISQDSVPAQHSTIKTQSCKCLLKFCRLCILCGKPWKVCRRRANRPATTQTRESSLQNDYRSEVKLTVGWISTSGYRADFRKGLWVKCQQQFGVGARQEHSHVWIIATGYVRRTVGGTYGHIPACLKYIPKTSKYLPILPFSLSLCANRDWWHYKISVTRKS
jgi:hypothetical protein